MVAVAAAAREAVVREAAAAMAVAATEAPVVQWE